MKNLLICVLTYGFIFSIHKPTQAQTSQKLFQQGMIQEEGEGDLPKAIEIYNSLVNDDSVDRKIRAKALLQVGICYEKLGNQNARKTYQKLISEYSDQEDVAAMGRRKLKGLERLDPGTKKEGIVVSQVLFSEQNAGSVSPDGRHLIYVDWITENNKPAINIKDLHKGTTRIVSKIGTWQSPSKFPDNPIWSPDGKQFAYYWYDVEGEGSELHIANTDGTNDEVFAKGSESPYPYAWSSNGKYIIGTVAEQIAIFSVNDHRLRVLKSLGSLKIDDMDISPDNKYIVYSLQQEKGSYENDIHLISIDGTVDKNIISDSANDFEPKWSRDGKNILFLSDRFGTNDLWKIKIVNENSAGIAELVKANLGSLGSPTKILGISNDQSLYYETSSSRSDIYLVDMNISTTNIINSSKRISNLDVTENTNPAISKDGRYIAFIRWQLFREAGLGATFLISIYDTKTGQIKNSNTLMYALGQMYWFWPKPQWSPNGDKVIFHGIQKENLIAGVFSYDIETRETSPIKVMPNYTKHLDIPSTGLYHIFSNDGENIYYLSTDRNNIFKYNIESKKENILYTNANPISYFMLSKDESQIAYVHFDDWSDLYVDSISGGKSKKIVSLTDENSFNFIGWDSLDEYFYYGNGKYLDIHTIMRVSLKGEDPEQIINLKDIFPNGVIREIVFDENNSAMAVEVMVEGSEIWKLEGVFND